MAYSTQTDLEKQISETELIQLTDDDGAGTVATDVVAGAIADADEEIDAYLGSRLQVPLSPVPGIVRKLGVEIAIYNLYARKHDTVPDVRKDRYKDAIALLTKVAQGLISLGATDPEGNPPETSGVEYSGKDQVFTSDKLDNF